ncbi:unnamed protein product [Adineta steineri]|uniref:Uncharacterized protein n=1 Tax=Adineta steineri TaxID=433720 RepID=A0A813MY85_9BILA|nr:unnamed protein product [Adineta steineri]CAF0872489.1 unnamed protein product [Adineta steineri]CAF3600428.1 unnamed protein product [Adineta steineri]CAF4100315.1 unnamed protein product [Adineta steineri]
MRVFRKRKKFGNFGGPPRDAEPLPDIVYQMGAEQAARYVQLRARSTSPYAGTVGPHNHNSPYIVGEEEGYEGEEAEGGRSSPLNFIANALGLNRSRSRAKKDDKARENFARSGSPGYFDEPPPGTPVRYRRRPQSPEMFGSRPGSPAYFAQAEGRGSPVHFGSHSRPGSPETLRRLQRAQYSQEMQRIERQQRRQQEMMMNNQGQYSAYPQQSFYPLMNSNVNNQAFSMMQQPQMYQPYY